MAFLSAQDLLGKSLGFSLCKRLWFECKLQNPPKETRSLACSHPIVWWGEKTRRERKYALQSQCFRKKKNRHKSNAFLKCQNRGQIGKFHAFLTAKIFHCKGNLNTKGQMSQIRNIFMAVMKSKWVFPRKEIPLVSQCILNRSWFALSN